MNTSNTPSSDSNSGLMSLIEEYKERLSSLKKEQEKILQEALRDGIGEEYK